MEEASELVRRAAAARAVESTAMNAVSSRSHVVFMLYISGTHAPSNTRLQGCLCLVDLAGRWERCTICCQLGLCAVLRCIGKRRAGCAWWTWPAGGAQPEKLTCSENRCNWCRSATHGELLH